jgi:hypothetical protein
MGEKYAQEIPDPSHQIKNDKTAPEDATNKTGSEEKTNGMEANTYNYYTTCYFIILVD